MKILRNAVFVFLLAAIAASYLLFSGAARPLLYSFYEKFAPAENHSEKVVVVTSGGGLREYTVFLEKTKKISRTVVLFMPHIFDRGIGDFLQGSAAEDIENLRSDYRAFTIVFAESQNLIPVVSVKRLSGLIKGEADLSAYSYFKASAASFDMPVYGGVRIKNTRLWMTAPNVGFFPEYQGVPHRVPFLIRNRADVLAAAHVEAVRKFYGLTKSKIDTLNRMLSIGSGIQIPLLQNAEAVIRRPARAAPEIKFAEFIGAPEARFEDKIIIFRDASQPRVLSESLAAAVSAVLSGRTLGYNEVLNFAAAFILALLLFSAYRNVKPGIGSAVFLLSVAAVAGAGVLLLSKDYFLDITPLIFLNTAVFTGYYFLKISADALEKRRRTKVFASAMHPKAVKNFINAKKDIRLRNAWLNTAAVYFDFENGTFENPAALKKVFDKISVFIYNNVKEFIIELHGNNTIAVVPLQDSLQPAPLFKALFEIRDELKDAAFNIMVNAGKIYIFEFAGSVSFMDSEYQNKQSADRLLKKKNIIVAEKDIQKFINVIKFQKISGADKAVLFNVAGFREEG